MSRAGAALLALAAALAGAAAPAQEVASVRVSQAYARLPEVVAYLDAVDADQNPVQSLDQVAATLQERSLQLDKLVSFEQSGEGTAYLFLVDVSKSLRQAQFNQIRAAIERWISGLDAADRAAILSFGDAVNVVRDFTNDQGALRAALGALGPTDQKTQLHLALQRALEVGRRQDPGLPTRRVIVILSDGKDEGSGLTEEDVAALLRDDPLPIYAIGYSGLRGEERGRFLGVLNRFAQLSGGIFFAGTDESLEQDYERIRLAIHRVWVARFTCSACQADGRIHPLVVDVTAGDKVFSQTFGVRALQGRPPAEPTRSEPVRPRWVLPAALGAALLLAVLGWWAWSRRRQGTDELVEFGDLPPTPVAGERPSAAAPGPGAAAPEHGAAGRNLRLVVVHGQTTGQTYDVELQRRCVVGSEGGNDLALDEVGIEPHHFELFLQGQDVWIRDLTEQRKTSVNGVPIAGSFQLESGDLVRAGRTEMRVVF